MTDLADHRTPWEKRRTRPVRPTNPLELRACKACNRPTGVTFGGLCRKCDQEIHPECWEKDE